MKLEDLESRILIWIALSDLYLDTELQESDFDYIAQKMYQSPYTFEKIRKIDKEEVFPVLFSNLLSPAGEWFSFNEQMLINYIKSWIHSRSALDVFAIQCVYPIYREINKNYWKRLEEKYRQIKKMNKNHSR